MSDILASIRRTLEADDATLADHMYRRERARRAEIEEAEALLRDVEDETPPVPLTETFERREPSRIVEDRPGAGRITDAPPAGGDEQAGEEAVWGELDALLAAAEDAFAPPPELPAPPPQPLRREPPPEARRTAPAPRRPEPRPDPAPEQPPQPAPARQAPAQPTPTPAPPVATPAPPPHSEPVATVAPSPKPVRKPAPAVPAAEPRGPVELPDSGRRKTVLSRVAAAVKKETVRRLAEKPPEKGAPSAEIQALLSGEVRRRPTPVRRAPVADIPAAEPRAEPPSEAEFQSLEAQKLEALELTPDAALPPQDAVLDLTTPVDAALPAPDDHGAAPAPEGGAQAGVGERLLSRASTEAAAMAFKALADPDGPAAKAILERARLKERLDDGALDSLAGETLKPMLSDWLDENLPDLITRLVREELSRARDDT